MKKIMVILIALLTGASVSYGSVVDDAKKALELKKTVFNIYNLGAAYYREQQFEAAVPKLKESLEYNRDNKEAHAKIDFQANQMLGIIYFNSLGNYKEAIKYFKAAIDIDGSDADNYYFIGLAYRATGDNENAIVAFRTALDKGYSDTTEINFRLGQIFYEKKIYADAIKHFNRVIESKKDHIDARMYLGNIYHKRKDHKKAIENFKKVIQADPNNFEISYMLGLNYFSLKDYAKMISAYKKAITINPNYADAHYNLGMAYFYRNEYENAVQELEEAKKLNPGDAATFSMLAQAKTKAYEWHLSKGTSYLIEEEYLKARDELRLALKAKPGDDEAKKNLNKVKDALSKKVPQSLKDAKNAFETGNYADAYNGWEFVLQVEPKNSEAKSGMAKIEKNLSELTSAKKKLAAKYMKQRKYKEAVAEYRAALKLAPKGQKKSIRASLNSAKAKLSARIDALDSSAKKYFKQKLYKKALGKYHDILKYDENNENALDGITKINATIEKDKTKYTELGKKYMRSNKEKAIKYFKKVLALDPADKDANKHLKSITGRESKAAVDAKQVRALYYEGVDKYVNGDIETAIKIWKKVLTIDKGHVEAKKNISRAEAKLAAIKSLGK